MAWGRKKEDILKSHGINDIYLNTELSDLSTIEPVTFNTKYMMEVIFITFTLSQPISPCLLLEVCTDE